MSTPAEFKLILELVSQKIASSTVSPVIIIIMNTQGEQGGAGGQLSFLIERNN